MAREPARKQKCTAHSKRTGEPCGNWAVIGRNVCRLHGGRAGAPPGNENALKTGENARTALTRAEEFERDRAEAPIEPTPALQERMRDDYARLRFMYRLLLQTEQQMMDLASGGDVTALGALAVVEKSRKQEPRTTGQGEDAKTELVDVELSEKSRSLLDTWIAQHDAITRVELLYGKTAERLKPANGILPGAGAGGGTTIIVNNGIPGVDFDPDE